MLAGEPVEQASDPLLEDLLRGRVAAVHDRVERLGGVRGGQEAGLVDPRPVPPGLGESCQEHGQVLGRRDDDRRLAELEPDHEIGRDRLRQLAEVCIDLCRVPMGLTADEEVAPDVARHIWTVDGVRHLFPQRSTKLQRALLSAG